MFLRWKGETHGFERQKKTGNKGHEQEVFKSANMQKRVLQWRFIRVENLINLFKKAQKDLDLIPEDSKAEGTTLVWNVKDLVSDQESTIYHTCSILIEMLNVIVPYNRYSYVSMHLLWYVLSSDLLLIWLNRVMVRPPSQVCDISRNEGGPVPIAAALEYHLLRSRCQLDLFGFFLKTFQF